MGDSNSCTGLVITGTGRAAYGFVNSVQCSSTGILE